jgi:hypothetical protein
MNRRAFLAGGLSIAALASATAAAQSVPGGRAAATVLSASSYDPAALTYFAAMTVQPDAPRKALINTLIVGLKADGVWTKLDWLVLLASHDTQASLLNAKAPAKILSAVSSPTFTTDRGWTGDGVGAYLLFPELFNAAGNGFTQDSATIGEWCNLQGAGGGLNQYHFGNTNGTNPSTRIASRGDGGSETFKLNNSTTLTAVASSSRLGHRTVTRNSGNPIFYKAGAQTANPADTSVGVSATAPCLLRDNAVYTVDRLASAYFGAGMTAANVAAIHTRLGTFLTAIGAN